MTLTTQTVGIPVQTGVIEADMAVPTGADGVVVFAHGSGSGRGSPRNRQVAEAFVTRWRLGIVLVDLLTEREAEQDARTRELRFDVGLLGSRVCATLDWLQGDGELTALGTGLFGASTGAAAALIAAAQRPDRVSAVVSRGGRPDLAADALPRVRAPALLIVGGDDVEVLALNQRAQALMEAETRLEIVPGAGHLFEEPGAMDRVVELAGGWFQERLVG